MLLKFYETNLRITLVEFSIESNSFNELGAEIILNKVHIKILLKYFRENIYRIFEFENIKFGHYSKKLGFNPSSHNFKINHKGSGREDQELEE